MYKNITCFYECTLVDSWISKMCVYNCFIQAQVHDADVLERKPVSTAIFPVYGDVQPLYDVINSYYLYKTDFECLDIISNYIFLILTHDTKRWI